MEQDTETAALVDETPKLSPVKIELRQLVGTAKHMGKVYRVAHDVDVILLDGKEVGQVGREPGLGVSILVGAQITKRQEEAIAAAIAAKRGRPPAQFTYHKPAPIGKVLDDDEEGESDEFTYE